MFLILVASQGREGGDMWVDETAGQDPTGSGVGGEDMTITVEGQEYSAEINHDINDDGVADTAVIERSDGSVQAFVDEDGDGDADEYVKLDSDGNVLSEAQYDDSTGEWVSTGQDGDAGGSTDTRTSSGGMTADLPAGEVSVGQPTVDTNNDGVADTAVVEDNAGNSMMFTDVDGDGEADVVVVVTPSGESTTYQYAGDGEWTRIDSSTTAAESYVAAGAAGGFTADGGSDGWGGLSDPGDSGQHATGIAHIDPATGQWVSPG